MAKRPKRSQKNQVHGEVETFWQGVGGWTGLPLSVASNSRVRLRHVAWEQLEAPCVVAFVTASQETRMGRIVQIAEEGMWLGSEGSESRYFWERKLVQGLALVLEVKAGGKGKTSNQSLRLLPELGWTPSGHRSRVTAIDRMLRVYESLG